MNKPRYILNGTVTTNINLPKRNKMSDYEEHAWDDFNHYMHTGELSEYFEEETEETDEYVEDDTDTQEE